VALLAAAFLSGSCGRSDPLVPVLGPDKLTIIVLVVDSLEPDEVAGAANLNTIKTAGTFYDQSRSVYTAETIPNHVAMMTGVYPDRSGIPTNDFIDDFAPANPPSVKLSIPERLTASTLFTWIDQACGDTAATKVRTGAVLSKKYLYDVFHGDAFNDARANDDADVFNVAPDVYDWNPSEDPAFIPAPDEHVPDAQTMTQARARLPNVDFFFINLGDVDRAAHAGGDSARTSALADTGTQVGQLLSDLQSGPNPRWANTILFLVSDHAMDISAAGPATEITTQAMLDTIGACTKPMKAVPSGGTESIYVLDRQAPLEDRQAAVRAARSCLLGTGCACGAMRPANFGLIAGAWYTVDDPLDPAGNMPASVASRQANLGDLTVFAAPTGKFGDPPNSSAFVAGQIPGNHGHPATLRNTFIVSGGSPWVKAGKVIASSSTNPDPASLAALLERLPEQSENVDLAPTVAWLLGLDLPAAGFPDYTERGKAFDGRVLKEAFTQFDADANAPSPTVCGRF
jgi:hypothetical protein